MVNENTFGGVHNFPVQADYFCFSGPDFDISSGIEFRATGVKIPIEMAEAIINIGVNNRPYIIAEVNPAKR
jgi:hypothetical protein